MPTPRKHVPADTAAQRATIEQSFPVIAEQKLARVERSALAAVTELRLRQQTADPKAAFFALFEKPKETV